jgi:acetylornithine deacetylase/succinyl-diaminopimelate desuccinylase-like protein
MKQLIRSLVFVALMTTLVSAADQPPKVAGPNLQTTREEIVTNLVGFVRVDTSNPPGNETKGAQFVKAILDKEGIESEIFELEPGRGNLVARLKGSGKKKPLLLMGHSDVVGVEREKWTVDPFAGVVKGGFVYGRGSSDDKAMTMVCLEIFLQLHRLKTPLARDVILLVESGEEATTSVGIDFMVAKHWDKIECEFALNEGGGITEIDGKVEAVRVSTSEKVPRPILLSAKGVSGHGSMPRMDNAIVHLAAAVAKVGEWQPPMRLNDTTRAYFQRLCQISTPEEAFTYSHLEDPILGPLLQDKLRATNITHNSMLRTSISPTIFKAGFRNNVIPGDALATLDVRALPDENMEEFAAKLREVINDPAVEVILSEGHSRPATPPSPLDSEMFQALERAQKKLFPSAITLPSLTTGATDSAQLRARGVKAYGLGNVAKKNEASRIHGNDERTSIAGLGMFFDFTWTAVIDVAGE